MHAYLCIYQISLYTFLSPSLPCIINTLILALKLCNFYRFFLPSPFDYESLLLIKLYVINGQDRALINTP